MQNDSLYAAVSVLNNDSSGGCLNDLKIGGDALPFLCSVALELGDNGTLKLVLECVWIPQRLL